jgi:agmatinase
MSFYFATAPYPKADIIIVGVPFDRTSSFIPGTRFAPSAIRNAFENVESYSPYRNKDLTSFRIYDANDIIFSSLIMKKALSQIEKTVEKHLRKKKRVFALGGEHTITIPIVQAYKKFFPQLKVIQFDAHADWRDEYFGEKFCHATAIRRVAEVVGKQNVIPIGIRSFAQEETKERPKPFKIGQPIDKVVQKLGNTPVYITLDIDVLDTSTMPAVATPEPGGISFLELISALTRLGKCKIVGADLVEYNPLAAPSLAYASTAAVLMRELIILLANNI